MSWQMTALVKERFKGPPALKLLAFTLADYADPEGSDIFPSVARLAVDVGMSERSIERHMARLREIGFIELVGNSRGGVLPRRSKQAPMGRSNRYRINAGWWKSEADKLSPLAAGNPPNGCGTPTPETLKGDTAMSPEYSIEDSTPVERAHEANEHLRMQADEARERLRKIAARLGGRVGA